MPAVAVIHKGRRFIKMTGYKAFEESQLTFCINFSRPLYLVLHIDVFVFEFFLGIENFIGSNEMLLSLKEFL